MQAYHVVTIIDAVLACCCSVLQRMLRRNPLAALSLQQPSIRTPSLKLADDVPFELDPEDSAVAESPDGNDLLQSTTFRCLCC